MSGTELFDFAQSHINGTVVIHALLLMLAFAWGSRCYWRGRSAESDQPVEDGGWADEAKWWRANFVQFTRDCRGATGKANTPDALP